MWNPLARLIGRPEQTEPAATQAGESIDGRPLFEELGDAVGVPAIHRHIRVVLASIHDDVYEKTVRTGDPILRPELLALFRRIARLSVRSVHRGDPSPARLDDRAAVNEMERLDTRRHVAEDAVEQARARAEARLSAVAAAREAVRARPWLVYVGLIVLWLLTPVAMTWYMYETFVGVKAANGMAAEAMLAGASAILGDMSPVDQAILACFSLTFIVTGIVTWISLTQARMGLLVKLLILALEGGLGVTLYWMRASAGADAEANSMAYASVELLLTTLHGIACILLGGVLSEAVAAQRAVERAELEYDDAHADLTDREAKQVETDAAWRRQVAWYKDLVDHRAGQVDVEAQAEDVAEAAYRLALQHLAAQMLGGQALPQLATAVASHAAPLKQTA